MKKSIIVFLCLFVTVCRAQKIDPVIVLQDGSSVDCEHKFMDGEAATFRLKKGTGSDIRWTFNIFGKKGENVQVMESDYGADSFTLNITPDLLPMMACDCKQVDSESDLSVYICGSVYLYKGETAVDSLPVLLNVLPSRPVVKTASLDGEFSYQYVSYYPQPATVEIIFASDRMESCHLLNYVSDSLFAFQFPKNYTLLHIPELNWEKVGDFYKVQYRYADSGEFYQLSCWNKYGEVLGVDTIFTNDLISDKDVLDFLETFRPGVGIDGVSADDVRVAFNGNVLMIEGNIGALETAVYSSGGLLKYKGNSENRIDLNFLEKGVYIVRIKLKNEKVIIKKIIKS